MSTPLSSRHGLLDIVAADMVRVAHPHDDGDGAHLDVVELVARDDELAEEDGVV